MSIKNIKVPNITIKATLLMRHEQKTYFIPQPYSTATFADKTYYNTTPAVTEKPDDALTILAKSVKSRS